jgi:hypothetical protein
MKKRRIFWATLLLLGLALGAVLAPYAWYGATGLARGERFYHGMPSSYWRQREADLGTEARPALPALVERLEDIDARVAVRAARLLWQLDGSTLGTAALLRALGNHNKDTRASAALVLGEIGPEARSAVPSLLRAEGDGEESVRAEVIRALKRILGERLDVKPLDIFKQKRLGPEGDWPAPRCDRA